MSSAGGRLVEQQHRRLLGERARDEHALELAARQRRERPGAPSRGPAVRAPTATARGRAGPRRRAARCAACDRAARSRATVSPRGSTVSAARAPPCGPARGGRSDSIVAPQLHRPARHQAGDRGSSVVLPAPLGPTTYSHSPSATSSATSSIGACRLDREPRTSSVVATSPRIDLHAALRSAEHDDEERRAEERGDDADRDLRRRDDGARHQVGEHQERGAEEHRQRQHER